MSDFKTKMHQKKCSAPDPARGAYSAPPDLLAGFGGPTSKERGGEGKGGEGREGEGKGHEPPLFGGSLRLWVVGQLKSPTHNIGE